MTPTDFRSTLAALGISQARFARLVRANKDTPTNWSQGRTEIPGSVELLLKLLASGAATVEQLEAL